MHIELRGHDSDPAAAWRLVGDTEHLNRLADNPRMELQLVPDAHGFPEVQGQMFGPGPVRHRYREVDSRWVSGRWFEQLRLLSGPLLRRTRYQARIESGEGSGVVPVLSLELEFANRLVGAVAGPLVRRDLKRWQQALDQLPAPGESMELPRRRVLPSQVEAALERWRQREVDEALVERIARWMAGTRHAHLLAIRPFVLAEEWEVERRELVAAFVEGTRVGALELYWAVRCPRCGGGVGQADALSDLADHASCPSCRIDFDAELDRNVEVLFAAHPAIRPEPGERFCTMYPAARPEVLALTTMEPGSQQRVEVDLPPGRWSLGAGGTEPDAVVEVHEGGPQELRWQPGQERMQAASGPVALHLHNPGEARIRVQLSGDPDGGRWLSAAWLSTMPEYRRGFGSVVLAPDVRIGVRAVAVLFTDLTGSAALYAEHGDAAAFRLLHDHFAVLEQALSQHHGVRVKTIGDAIMATFVDPAHALAAALAMQQDFDRWARSLDMRHPPGLRVGLHFGPAMAVHTDQAGMDYFGGTINLAARCEGRAERGEVVWTDEVHRAPGVYERIRAWGGRVERWQAEIKGLPEPVPLYRARVVGPPADAEPEVQLPRGP